MSEVEVPNLLDLSDADTSGFSPLEPGRYNAELFEMKWDATKNAGKVPVGTPLLKMQFKLTDEGVNNRRVFAQFVVPPAGHDPQKAATMKGMIANAFIGIGFSEEQVKSKDFAPNFDELTGQPCVVVIGKEPKKDRDGNIIEGEFNNPVKGIKPAGSETGSNAAGGSLL